MWCWGGGPGGGAFDWDFHAKIDGQFDEKLAARLDGIPMPIHSDLHSFRDVALP